MLAARAPKFFPFIPWKVGTRYTKKGEKISTKSNSEIWTELLFKYSRVIKEEKSQ